jgi:hypothetical protein
MVHISVYKKKVNGIEAINFSDTNIQDLLSSVGRNYFSIKGLNISVF